MTTETMNVHKALIELKILSERINEAIRDASFCTAVKNTETKIKGQTVADYKTAGQGSWDKIHDLIARQRAIKCELAKSNASTTVQIEDRTYTVAEAIWLNQNGINYEQLLLNKMETEYANEVRKMELQNANVEQKAEDRIRMLGGKTNSEDNPYSAETLTNMANDYIEKNRFDLVQGIEVKAKTEDLRTHIDKFKAEVDAALSVSNANTIITISY